MNFRKLASFIGSAALLFLTLAFPDVALAQSSPSLATVVAACGTPPNTYAENQNRPITQDTTGKLCDSGGGGGGGTVTANQGAAGTSPWPVSNTPVATATSAGITDVSSASLESNHVLKSSAGNLYSLYATTGAFSGWLLTYDGTTAPTAGGAAIAPKDCIVAPANSTIGLAVSGDAPDPYASGIVAIFSTSGCLTNTASVSVFFKARVK